MSEAYTDSMTVVPTTRPEGSPELRPLMALPRRQKGGVLKKLAELAQAQKALADGDGEVVSVDLSTADPERIGLMFDLLADFEDLLKSVAVDEAAFDAWNEHASDQDLAELVRYYMGAFQPGEAPASSSS